MLALKLGLLAAAMIALTPLTACSRRLEVVDLRDFASELDPGSVVLLGEIHGTKEFPEFAGDLIDSIASMGSPVVAALEMPLGDQAGVQMFIESQGTDADRDALLSGQHWSAMDGRASEAMLALVERLRSERQTGERIEVRLFDPPGGAALAEDATSRDQSMAEEVLKVAEGFPDHVVVVLTGNVHAIAAPTSGVADPRSRTMGSIVRERLGEKVISLEGVGPTGDAWTCTATGCGPHAAGRATPAHTAGVSRQKEPTGGYHGQFFVRSVSASPPARH